MLKYFKISILLVCILSCKQALKNGEDNARSTPVKSKNTVKPILEADEEISSCQVSETTKIIISNAVKSPQNVLLSIEQKSGNQKTIVQSDKLEFIVGEKPEITVHCYNDQFQIQYLEQMGNSYYTTRHVFEPENTLNDFVLTKIYKAESTRQGFSILAAVANDKTNFKNYKGIEGEVAWQSIYIFSGYQEEKEPSINSFYEQVKTNSAADKVQQLEFISNEYVLNYLLENIPIDSKNLSKYNDIAYYLKQSKLYNASVFLLEEVISTFPDRTVAYINLGDAYKGLNNNEKANKAYERYVALMKRNDKENEIPQKVWDNIKK